MSLIICPECGKEISSMAKACPQCGYPVEENTLEYQVKKAIEEHSPVRAIQLVETRGYSPKEAHKYVWGYIEKYPDVLECKLAKMIKEEDGITAIEFMEDQGYSVNEAFQYIDDIIEKYPECNIHEPPQPAPLYCPNCGSRAVKEAWFSIYDHKCEVCGHEWVRCPKCGKSNIQITRAAPISAVKSSFNKCKNCGHEWRRY